MLTRMVGRRKRVPSPEELDERRANERAFVMSYDTSETDLWFIIDSQWLSDWKSFISTSCPGPLPGPISNQNLLERGSGKPREGLEPVLHYRGLNAAVWAFLHERYGGGPELRRSKIDLYSPPISVNSSAEPLLARSIDDMDEFPAADREDCLTARGRSRKPPSSFFRRSGFIPSRSRSGSTEKRTVCAIDGEETSGACNRTDKSENSSSENSVDRTGQVFFVKDSDAQVTTQPPDGSCLFHSLSAGLADGEDASLLRLEISKYIMEHPDMLVAGTSLEEWVKHDSGEGVNSYATKMAGDSWGGGIEMEVLSRLKDVNVHVFEKCENGFQRICCFDVDGAAAKRTVNVLYQGRNHYDALTLLGKTGDWVSRRHVESRL